jgi:nucleoside-diphosphate-sugar epimerase
LSSGLLTTIENAVKSFCNILDKNLKYSFSGNSIQGYPKGVFADISKAKQIGFVPKYTLEQGLKKTIEWIKEQKQ